MERTRDMNAEKRRTILVIEDNSDLRVATVDMLQALGFEVTVAQHAARAAQLLESASFDLALVNAYPSRGRGLDAVDALRAQAPRIPVLLTSGFGDDIELRQRVTSGDVGFLPVPFSRQNLERKIFEALEHEPGGTSSAPATRPRAVRPRAGAPKRGRTGVLLAAAAAIVAAGLVFQLADLSPRMPDPEATEVRRGGAVELVEPIGALAERPLMLAWREAPGSTRYRVVLSTVDDTTIWQFETQETSIELPREIAERLHSAVSYFWQVESIGRNSSVIGRSRLVAFRFGASEPV